MAALLTIGAAACAIDGEEQQLEEQADQAAEADEDAKRVAEPDAGDTSDDSLGSDEAEPGVDNETEPDEPVNGAGAEPETGLDALGLSADLPAGWYDATEELASHIPGAIPTVTAYVMLVDEDKCGPTFCDNINIITEPAGGLDTDGYLVESMAGFAEMSAEILDEREAAFAGEGGYELHYTVAAVQPDLEFLVRFTVHDGQAYVATFTATEDTFAQHRNEAKAILDSLTFDE